MLPPVSGRWVCRPARQENLIVGGGAGLVSTAAGGRANNRNHGLHWNPDGLPTTNASPGRAFGRAGGSPGLLVLVIGSSFRVLVEVLDGPGEGINDECDQFVEKGAIGCALPLAEVVGHIEQPEVDGVAPQPEMFDGIVRGAGLDDDGLAVLASA